MAAARWYRALHLAELRSGDPDRAIDDYVGHDRVHQATSDDAVRDRLVDVWMNARVEGEDVLMVAARLADVDDLNRRARDVLQDECYLGDDEVTLGGRPFAEGDDVVALRNEYHLGLLNGTRATVERIDTTRHELAHATTAGARLVAPFAYAEARHLTHGYATTIHKAQGATVDRCFVLADDTMTLSVPRTGREGRPGPMGVCQCGQIGCWARRRQGFEMRGRGRWVQAAVRYSLMSPPQVVCRWIGSAGAIAARSSHAGARCPSERCGRCWL